MSEWTVVRCSQGALYSTIWMPLVSLKAVRLGAKRLQRCPVHRRWEKVERVKVADLTDAQRTAALQVRDIAIP